MESSSDFKNLEEVEFVPSNSKMSFKEQERKMINGRRIDRDVEWSKPNDDLSCDGFCTRRMKCYLGSGGMFFFILLIAVLIGCSTHKIMQGTVGIYFVGGALKDKVTQPGIHFCMPFITNIERIQIRPRTDRLPPISTVTKDGIANTFRDVQVISDVQAGKVVPLVKKYGLEFHETLVFDRIYEEIRIFCAEHTIDEVYSTMFDQIVDTVRKNVVETIKELGEGGITISHLVIPKPDIPPDIAANYKAVKVQWTQQLVATQQQKTEKIRKETETIKAVADAERQKKVLEIDVQKQILQKQGDKQISTLENEILKERKQAAADAEKYTKEKQAEANKLLFDNDGYVQLEMAKSLSTNTKFFFSGDQSPLGSVFARIMGEDRN